MKTETKKVGAVAAFGLACFLGGTFGGNAAFVEGPSDACRAGFKDSNVPEEFVERNIVALCPDVKTGAIYMMISGVAGGLIGVGLGAAIASRKPRAPKDPAP